jgi:tetratricopeptide (TPR) repeat protein
MKILLDILFVAALLSVLVNGKTQLVKANSMSAEDTSKLLFHLNRQYFELYQQGRYGDATRIAEKALKIAGDTFGPHYPHLAVVLNDVPELYRSQGRYRETERLEERVREFSPQEPH